MTELPPQDSFEVPALDLSGIAEKVQKVVTCEVLGVLEPADLAAALERGTPPADRSTPTSGADGDLRKVRERHHSVARLIASGLSQRLVAEFCGYDESYLATLLNAPAMVDLVGFYRGKHLPAVEIQAEKLRTIAGLGLDALINKLTAEGTNASEMDTNELIALVKLGADRSGNGPSSQQHIVQENHNFDHAELQRLSREAKQGSASRIIDQTPATPSLPAPEDLGDASS